MSNTWLEIAEELSMQMINRYVNSDGLLAERVDCALGRIVDPTPLVDELGDYAQYIAYLGQLISHQDLVAWSEQQVETSILRYQAFDGLIQAQHSPFDGLNSLHKRYISLLNLGDTIWGMVGMYLISPRPSLLRAIDYFCDGVQRLSLCNKMIPYGAFRMGLPGLPYLTIPLAEPMTTGYFSEPLVYLYQRTGTQVYIEQAKGWILPWLDNPHFKRYGLFARSMSGRLAVLIRKPLDWQFRYRGRPGMDATILVKGDTYLIFALIALYRVTHEPELREAILHWKNAVATYAVASDGRFYNHVDARSGNAWQVRLDENHSVIEALLDIAHDLQDEKSLRMARHCVDTWLMHRSKLGLIPNIDQQPWAALDPQIDFAINVLKLSVLEQNSNYRTAALELLKAVLERHRLQYGYAWNVHSATGMVQSGEIETKFLGLMIKALLVFSTAENLADPMAKADWRYLATDR